MTSLPFILAVTLFSLNAASLLLELHQETNKWRQNDLELAANAEIWSPELNNILELNHSLTSIDIICSSAPTPQTVISLKASARSIEFSQELMWRMIQAQMNHENFKGKTFISNTIRTNPGPCTKGHFSFDSNPLFSSYRRFSGIEIFKDDDSIFWKFRHPNVKRRL